MASAKQPKLAMSDEEIGEIYDGTPPEGIEISDSESEASDPDDEAVMPVSEHNKKIAWWSKRYTDLKIKYEKLFDKYIAANDLNTQLTKSLMGSKVLVYFKVTPLRNRVIIFSWVRPIGASTQERCPSLRGIFLKPLLGWQIAQQALPTNLYVAQ